MNPAVAAQITAKRVRNEPPEYEVLEENWTAVRLFLACSGQWQITPTGKLLGLRHEAVDVSIRRGGFEPLAPQDWNRFLLLERVITTELNSD